MSVDYRSLGGRVKAQRKGQHMTQEVLAEKLSVSVGYISQVERGVTKVSLDLLSELSEALGCSMTLLIEGSVANDKMYLTEELGSKFDFLNEESRRLLLDIADVVLMNQNNNIVK